MSNSSLVDYTKISPNKTSPRNHVIDTITIHCYVGQASVESAGSWFAKRTTMASCNYMIGYDGKVALIVDEKDRSWCSSSPANDHRAITIECASEKTHPYAVNDVVYQTLIDLIADICKRNNIKQLLWKADKNLIGQVDKQNMTVHRWFKNKACPGDYLYNRHGEIANKVNAILNPVKDEKPQTSSEMYCVQTGAFTKEDNAKKLAAELNGKGFSTYITKSGSYYKVQVGAYSLKMNATNMQKKLQAAGYDTLIAVKKDSDTSTPAAPAQKPAPAPTPVVEKKKTAQEVAQEIVAGKGNWGTGNTRKQRVKAYGLNYDEVQKIVNQLMSGKTAVSSKKSNEEIAKEVLAGKWGNGAERKRKLTQAGYDYNAIQKIVNKKI